MRDHPERPFAERRAHKGTVTFEILQPAFKRRCRLLPDGMNFRHRLSAVRDGNGSAVAHLPDDLRESRLGFVDRVREGHAATITSQTRYYNSGAGGGRRGAGRRRTARSAGPCPGQPRSSVSSGRPTSGGSCGSARPLAWRVFGRPTKDGVRATGVARQRKDVGARAPRLSREESRSFGAFRFNCITLKTVHRWVGRYAEPVEPRITDSVRHAPGSDLGLVETGPGHGYPRFPLAFGEMQRASIAIPACNREDKGPLSQ